jgi:pteridine reductase
MGGAVSNRAGSELGSFFQGVAHVAEGGLSLGSVTSASDGANVALVTGGAIRVGRGIVEALVRASWRVWIHHRASVDAAQALRAELDDEAARAGRASPVVGLVAADLSETAGRERLCDHVLAPDGPANGRIDLLVNSAASFERGAFEARTDDDLRRVLELNLVAPIALARRLAPALRASQGSIVNILDVVGMQPVRGYFDHAIAKAGLAMGTRALALELAPVRANAVVPGTVDWPTDPRYAEGSPSRDAVLRRIPLRRIGAPKDIGEAVVFLAGAPFVSGTSLVVDGGRLAALGDDRA